MGHNITAVIGAPAVVARVASVANCPSPTKLKFGLEIAPLGYQQIDELTALKPGQYFEGFQYLSEGLQNALMQAAGKGALAYIETNYFGGTGGQAAALFLDGHAVARVAIGISRRPAHKGDPINTVLRALGVEAVIDEDEFAALDLQRFRDLESLGFKEWDDE